MNQPTQCKGNIKREFRPKRQYVMWRRRCKSKTTHESGYCHVHRVAHTTTRK